MAVYFIQDSRTHAIKIGFTEGEASDRAGALQTGNPGELIVLCVLATGTRQDESELHRRFATDRVAGEWFKPSPALLNHILRLAKSSGVSEGYEHGLTDAKPIRREEVLTPWLTLDQLWNGAIREDQIGPTLLVKCPCCGFEFNHLGQSETFEFDRGNGIRIPMHCEQGCCWDINILFQKGNSFMFVAERAPTDIEMAK